MWRRIKFRTMESTVQLVAGAPVLRIATRPGAKVEKIVEIKWDDGPNGADIGGPDVQELWVMGARLHGRSDRHVRAQDGGPGDLDREGE